MMARPAGTPAVTYFSGAARRHGSRESQDFLTSSEVQQGRMCDLPHTRGRRDELMTLPNIGSSLMPQGYSTRTAQDRSYRAEWPLFEGGTSKAEFIALERRWAFLARLGEHEPDPSGKI
jgi:hypothetical protein